MSNLFKVLVLFALIVGTPLAAKADVEDGTVVDAQIVAPLMAWVERQTGVRVPSLPHVVASREQFRAILARMGGRTAGRARSLYLAGEVLLDNEMWDPEDSTELSLLVHELVHYAQSYMPRSAWSCRDAREAQAYTLQNKWLDEQGHNAFVSASWIRRVSSCGDATTNVALAQLPED